MFKKKNPKKTPNNLSQMSTSLFLSFEWHSYTGNLTVTSWRGLSVPCDLFGVIQLGRDWMRKWVWESWGSPVVDEGWVLWALWYTSSCFFLFAHVSVLSLHLKKWLGSMQMTWWFSFLQLFTWNTVCVGWIILDVPFVIAEFTAFCLPRSVRECSGLTQLSIWAQWSVWMREHVHSMCFPLGSLYWCCALHWFLL